MPDDTMRAALFHEHGGPEVVRVEEVPRPRPGRGEALVEVRAAALNHLDLWVRRGIGIDTTMPHIGGSDIAGVVAGVGAGVTDALVGARMVVDPSLSCGRCDACVRGEVSLCRDLRILGEHLDGGLAEYVVVPASNLHPIPDHVSFRTAAALPVAYQTAWRALLSRARLRPGEEVLVIGASGGTAAAAVQIALLAGATVHAVTSGRENVERVRSLGAHHVIDRLEVDFSREVYQRTGRRGVDIVVENVGAATWEGSVRALAPGGRLVTYGATAGARVELDLRRLFWRQLELIGTTMASRAEFRAMLRAAWSGRLQPVIADVLPLDSTRDAHERLERGESFGKILVAPDPSAVA